MKIASLSIDRSWLDALISRCVESRWVNRPWHWSPLEEKEKTRFSSALLDKERRLGMVGASQTCVPCLGRLWQRTRIDSPSNESRPCAPVMHSMSFRWTIMLKQECVWRMQLVSWLNIFVCWNRSRTCPMVVLLYKLVSRRINVDREEISSLGIRSRKSRWTCSKKVLWAMMSSRRVTKAFVRANISRKMVSSVWWNKRPSFSLMLVSSANEHMDRSRSIDLFFVSGTRVRSGQRYLSRLDAYLRSQSRFQETFSSA